MIGASLSLCLLLAFQDGGGAERQKQFLLAKVQAAAAREIPKDKDAFEAERGRRRQELLRCLGLDLLPPRTPLNARITSTLEREGYRIELLVYESRPGFPVTAHLYVPARGDGAPFPVIVNPHGHWQHKKDQDVVQARAIRQARAGYLALVVDSPGFSFEGNAVVERRYAGTHDDLRLVLGATNAICAYVFDLMRGLDYLATRKDADLTRVGITGASGGGTATVYAFAAEERFKAAVPVVYATSLEVNPMNGCLCNHVPGTLQVGDRSDVLGIRAPAPVFIIGARVDPEFPPEGTERTGEKLKALYGVVGAADAVTWKIYECGHDYNAEMQAAAIGFFDKHLRGKGDGSPVAIEPVKTDPPSTPENRLRLCLKDPPTGLTTFRDIAISALARPREGTFADFVALNGGLPSRERPELRILQQPIEPGGASCVVFESERGLLIPGLLWQPEGKPRGGVVLLSDLGKADPPLEAQGKAFLAGGLACLAIDARGTGELSKIDLRLMTYLGTGVPFAMAVDATAAIEGLRRLSPKIAVVGRGPAASQAALFAALMAKEATFACGIDGVDDWRDCFDAAVPALAVQPRASLGPSLAALRKEAGDRVVWHLRGTPAPDIAALVATAFH